MSVGPTSAKNTPPDYNNDAVGSSSNQPPQHHPYPSPYQHQYQYPGMHPSYGGYPPPPGSYYPPPPPAPPPPQQQQQQQQQQQVVVINQNATEIVAVRVESFCAQIACSCLVLWFCNFIFGLIGFILAMIASDRAAVDPESANKLGKASWGVSISGMLLTILITAIVVGVVVGSAADAASSSSSSSGSGSGSSCSSSTYTYYYLGSCYRYKRCSVYSSTSCYNLASYYTYAYDSYNYCCYYD